MIRFNKTVIGYDKPLFDIETTFDENSKTLLLGANGVGKSTLFKTLIGFIKPLDGHIIVNGKSNAAFDVFAYMPSQGAKVGFMTAREYLLLGVEQLTSSLDELISSFKIANIVDSQITELSDGQFQKIRIAKSFFLQRKITILDEPLSFLDPYQVKQVVESIEVWLSKHSTTLLISTHQYRPFLDKSYSYLFLSKSSHHKGKLEEFDEALFGG